MLLVNFYSHTSQDSYTTFMKTQKGMGNHDASIASILMKTGMLQKMVVACTKH